MQLFRRALTSRLYGFSSGPYYTLGLEQDASFADIKKAYYKLAAQYHPDINKSSTAPKQFMIIKEAFEQIKQSRGEGTSMGVDAKPKQDFRSVRKNHKDYEETWNQNDQTDKSNDTDYQEFIHKSQDESGSEHERFRQGFKTLHDLKESNFKPIDMVMPDPSKRFGLQRVMKLKVFSDGSNFYIATLVTFTFLFFYALNYSVKQVQQRRFENYIYSLLNYQSIKDELDDEDFIERINYDLKKSVEYQIFVKKEEQKKQQSGKFKQRVPLMQDFISTQQLKGDANIPL